MRILRPIAVLLAVTLTGCFSDPGEPTATYPSIPVELTSTVHHTGDHLGLPAGIRLVDSDLVIIDRAGENNVHVVDAETGALKASMGGVGEGPTEFRAPIAIAEDVAGRVWVMDGGNHRSTRVDLARLDGPTDWAGETVALAAGAGIVDVAWTREGNLLASGLFADRGYGLLGPSGALLRAVGDVPPGAEREAADGILLSRIDGHPDLDRFAAVERWYPRITILTDQGRVLRVVEGPIHTEPELVVFEGRLLPSNDSFNAYADVAVTSTHIFALYCGRTHNRHGPIQNFGRDVHVFDWNGEFLTVLRLDRDAFTLEVDETGGRLFTVAHDPVPVILRYELPAMLLDPDDPPGGESSRAESQ